MRQLLYEQAGKEESPVENKEPVSEETDEFNIEEWRRECPMDYYKALDLLKNEADDATRNLTMRLIFEICKQHIPDSLFKYYSLGADRDLNTAKLKTLANQKVFAANINTLNDPFDCRSTYYRLAELKQTLDSDICEMLDDMPSWVLVSSYTACDENSMPMWAHYGANHAGYCVEYDMTAPENQQLRGLTFPVQYDNRRIDLTDFYKQQITTIQERAKQNMKMGIRETIITDLTMIYCRLLLCNIKHPSWSYEREYRCSIASRAPGAPYIAAKPKAIYIGMNCSDDHSEQLLQIARDMGAAAYRMAFNPSTGEYLLSKERLN